MNMPVANSLVAPTVFDTLLAPVQTYVDQQEQERPRHHNETFTYQEFFRLLVYYVVSNMPSMSLLLTTYLPKGLVSPALKLRSVPHSTVSDAFERFSPKLFRAVFVFLLGTVTLQTVPELAALGVLYCIDGSLFPTLQTMQWAAYKTTCQAIKLHLCFELNRMIPVDLVVGTGKSSERDALRQMLAAGVTYLADRGYVCFRLFHEVVTAQAHFIFRMKANLTYQRRTTLGIHVPLAARTLFQQITDHLIVCLNDPYQQVYRLVTFRVGDTTFLLLTDRRDLTTFQIMLLYAYRWQVELIFRFLKRTMTGIHLINHSEEGVTIYFYVLVIAAILQLHLKQHARLHHEQSDVPPPPDNPQSLADDSKNVFDDLPLNPQESHPYHFFDLLGAKLETYWKLGIHWLSMLRTILHQPFDDQALELLGSG